jgi:hypothetical protein
MNAMTTRQIEQLRRDLTEKMLGIRSARKGTIIEQSFPVLREGKPTGEMRGPHPLITTKKNGRTVSQRLKTPEQLEQARTDIANHQQLAALFKQFEELTEALGEAFRQESAPEEAIKKKPRPLSSRPRKSKE